MNKHIDFSMVEDIEKNVIMAWGYSKTMNKHRDTYIARNKR